VHDVVADLHVLEDLGQREDRGPGDGRRREPRADQQRPAGDLEPALGRDHSLDVRAVALAEVGAHGGADRVELTGEVFERIGNGRGGRDASARSAVASVMHAA
jgi:hypothetical protein